MKAYQLAATVGASEVKDIMSTSSSYDTIVSVEFDGTWDDFLSVASQATEDEIDYTRENDGSYDVWGWDEETPESEQNWRLNVRCLN